MDTLYKLKQDLIHQEQEILSKIEMEYLEKIKGLMREKDTIKGTIKATFERDIELIDDTIAAANSSSQRHSQTQPFTDIDVSGSVNTNNTLSNSNSQPLPLQQILQLLQQSNNNSILESIQSSPSHRYGEIVVDDSLHNDCSTQSSSTMSVISSNNNNNHEISMNAINAYTAASMHMPPPLPQYRQHYVDKPEEEHHKVYSCSICQQRFSRRSTLSNHVTTHKSAKPFQCRLCGKMFLTSIESQHHFDSRHRNTRG